MTAAEIVEELKPLGSASIKKVLLKHGIQEPLLGVKVGEVSVDVGDTSCKVPYAPDSIEKVRKKGSVGKKRKTAKC